MEEKHKEDRAEGTYKKSFRAGRTNFLVLVAAILFYFAMLRLPEIAGGIGKFFAAAKPVTYGLLIAYILNPLVKVLDGKMKPVFARKMEDMTAKKLSRGLSITIAMAILLAIIITLINLVVPNVYKSVKNLVQTMPDQIATVQRQFEDFQMKDPEKNAGMQEAVRQATESVNVWVDKNLVGKMDVIMTRLTQGVVNAVSEIVKVIIGLIVSIYVLYGKEKVVYNGKRYIYSRFKPARANDIIGVLIKTDKIFGGFIVGKIIDSLIIGVLCYVGNRILQMPYPVLVAALVGVTNVIPFFGPYLGAIPSFFLIAIESPLKGLYFLIFILGLQQLDGNVIGPKILGDSTGLDSFWVIFAILVGGGLFGVPGMILGVPTFALICYLVDRSIDRRLEEKHLPVKPTLYKKGSYVSEKGEFCEAPYEKQKNNNDDKKTTKK